MVTALMPLSSAYVSAEGDGLPAEVNPVPKHIQDFTADFNNGGWRMTSADGRWMVPGDWGFSRMANFSRFDEYPGDGGSGYIGLKSIAGDSATGTNGASIASPNWDFGEPADRYGYGYFEFRVKIADMGAPGNGVRSMFWIRGYDVDFNSADNDIRFAFNTTESWINSVDRGSVSLQGSTNLAHSLDFNPSKDFHTYGILWLPDRLEWWIDGKSVRQTAGNFKGAGVSIMLEQIVPFATNSPLSDTSTIYDFVKFYEFDASSLPVDKTALETLIAAAGDYTADGYTPDSWAAFAAALSSAVTVFNDAEASQADVDSAVTALQAAINGLRVQGAILPTNLIGNHDFTQSGLPGWINFGGAAREMGAGRNGSNAMVVTPGNAGANMPMTFLKENTTYYFGVWGKTEGTNANGITVGVQNLTPANPAQIYLIFNAGDYVYESSLFTTAATFGAVPEVIIWKDSGRDAKLYIDSLYLYEALVISAPPEKVLYNIGEALDLTGMFIDVFNAATQVYDRFGVSNGDVVVSGYDSASPGQKTVVISYGAGANIRRASFTVIVGAFEDIKSETLNPLVEAFGALNEADYSRLSWKLVSSAYDNIMAVIADGGATIDDVEKAAADMNKALVRLQASGVGAAPEPNPALPAGINQTPAYSQDFNPAEWNLNTDWVRSPDDLWQVSNWQAGFNNLAARSNFDMYESLPGFDGNGFMSLRTVGSKNNPPHLLNSGEIAAPEWDARAGDERLFGYGYYETRMKVADVGDSVASTGVCASFFVQSASGDPMFEIDFEFLTNGTIGDRPRDPWVLSDDYGYAALALHDSHPQHGRNYPVVYQRLDFNPSIDFFTYGILWLPDRVEWYIEGVCVRSVTGSFERTGVRIAMNNWTGDVIWGGLPPEDDAVSYYDYVRFYTVGAPPVYCDVCGELEDECVCVSDADFLKALAAEILKNGLADAQLVLSGNKNATLTLVVGDREFVLASNVNNLNVSGEIELPDGSGILVFDIRGNGSNVKLFEIRSR